MRNAHPDVKAKCTPFRVHNARMATEKPELARRLTEARKSAKFKKAIYACRRFGWSYDTYSQHERGERGFGRITAKKYADAYDVSLAWLYLGEGEMKKPHEAFGLLKEVGPAGQDLIAPILKKMLGRP